VRRSTPRLFNFGVTNGVHHTEEVEERRRTCLSDKFLETGTLGAAKAPLRSTTSDPTALRPKSE
jgi:hypothetical protein